MVFGGLYAGFPNKRSAIAGDIGAMYGMIAVELFGTIAISSVWRKLSFRATHIAERLGLLGLIIIGEGVIGTTKTTTRLMGRLGVYFEGCALIFAIILILVSFPCDVISVY
jgi:low temperature requirement protein LtrA